MRSAFLRAASLMAVLLAAPAAFGQSSAAAPLWLTPADVQSLQRDADRVRPLLQHCEREIAVAPQPVASYEPPPHYSASGASETDVSRRLAGDGNMAWRAALCYTATRDLRFAKRSQAILSAWGDTLASVKTEQGSSEINFDVPTYVLAASLVRGIDHWDDGSFRHFLRIVALPQSHIDRKNNHANWGVLLDASIAAYIGDANLLARARARWLQLMDEQVAPDGSLPLETCRSDTTDWCGGSHQGINGMSYTHYTLMPTTAAARIFDLQGYSVWQTPQGLKLASAYRRAAEWTLHPEEFPYYERNHGVLNGVRNAGYFALLQRVYPDEVGGQVLQQGSLGLNALEWLVVFNCPSVSSERCVLRQAP